MANVLGMDAMQTAEQLIHVELKKENKQSNNTVRVSKFNTDSICNFRIVRPFDGRDFHHTQAL